MHDPPVVRPDGSPARVMMVDDEAALAEVPSNVLRLAGSDVRTAGTGGGAVQLAGEFSPDAIVLDVILPDLDGWQALERLRHPLP